MFGLAVDAIAVQTTLAYSHFILALYHAEICPSAHLVYVDPVLIPNLETRLKSDHCFSL